MPRHLVLALLLLPCCRCGGDGPNTSETNPPGDTDTLPAADIASVVVSPEATMLTAIGEEQALTAIAFDEDGAVVASPVAWTSSDPTVVTVDEDGVVTAVAELGAAWITARIEEIASEPAMVYIAQPADGAVLFDDEQVVEGPTLLDEDPAGLVGLIHSLTVSGMEVPEVGTIVLAKQETAAGGRVVHAESTSQGVYMELELTSLDEAYRELYVSWEGDLDVGSLHRDGSEDSFVGFELGRLDCEASSEVELDPTNYDIDAIADFGGRFQVDISGHSLRSAELLVVGSLATTFAVSFELPDDWSGSIECSTLIRDLPLPIGGVLAAFVGPHAPIGAGFTLEGGVSGTAVEVGVSVTKGWEAELGFRYAESTGLQAVSVFEPIDELEPTLTFPTADTLRVQASAWAYATAGLAAGARRYPSLDFAILDAKGGPKAALDLCSAGCQVGDPELASYYGLSFAGEIRAGEDVEWVLRYLGLPDSFELAIADEWSVLRSPLGENVLDQTSLALGETLSGTITLEHVDLFGYNVNDVTVYEVTQEDGSEDFSLEALDTLTPTEGQEVFTWTWEPTADQVGEHVIAVFVTSSLATYLPLEITADSRQSVAVEPFSCSNDVDMIAIEAGAFTMGKPADEVSYYDGSDEIQHEVELTNDFCMGTYEVTEAEFQDYMGYASSYYGCLSCPTDCLTWHEAAAFANAVSDSEGLEQCYDCTGSGDKVLCDLASTLSSPYECEGYRLPTEAEWEYAARAGTTSAFSNGGNFYEGDADDRDGNVLLDNGVYLDDYAIWDGTDPGSSASVGSKLPNDWGLYDMHGNVYEYCQDWYQEDYGGDAVDPWGPSSSDRKARRSGSWNGPASFMRSASRAVSYPESQGGYYVGFRLARTAQ